MKHSSAILAAAALFTTSALAEPQTADISFYLEDNCQAYAGVGCARVLTGQCCHMPLDTLFAQKCGSNCGRDCQNTAMGLGSCCAECPQNLYGALWVTGSKPGKRSEESAIADAGNCTGPVVEHAFFGDQYFRINGDVPQEVTDTLIAAVANSTAYDDLPKLVHEYAVETSNA
ncbi:hypothetical protein LTR53_006640 [Teratosphaeriaceae sp. CCFEE 6253]|nr:hypothetical protein LTR53_006640 [Teratosphaeriaceae sp. CCFEE 6253]